MNIGLSGALIASTIVNSRVHCLAIVSGLLTLILTFEQAHGESPVPKLNYETVPDFFQLPPGENFVEVAGVAVNSKGHIYVFHRGKHPLMEFDSSGKFIRSIADDLFVIASHTRCEWMLRTTSGLRTLVHTWS